MPLKPEDNFSVTYYAPQPRAVLRVAVYQILALLRTHRRVTVRIEIGNHDALMEKQGAYFRLYEAQTRKLDDVAIGADKPIVPPHREHANA